MWPDGLWCLLLGHQTHASHSACAQHFLTDFLPQFSIPLPGTLERGCPFLFPTSTVLNISLYQDRGGGGPVETRLLGSTQGVQLSRCGDHPLGTTVLHGASRAVI